MGIRKRAEEKFDKVVGTSVRFARDIVLIFVVVTIVVNFGMQIVKVSGSSMEQTLTDGQRVIINKMYYLIKDPQVDDVISFQVDAMEYPLVKRIIAMENDIVDYDDGIIYINGLSVESEEYIMDRGDISYPYQVQEGEYFVMGDNLNTSVDSRHSKIGTITDDDIVGKIMFH